MGPYLVVYAVQGVNREGMTQAVNGWSAKGSGSNNLFLQVFANIIHRLMKDRINMFFTYSRKHVLTAFKKTVLQEQVVVHIPCRM